jgi:sarcosine oxidase
VTAADVVVVGLGAMGSATLYQLARRGVRAIGIDRFTPPHDRGSSHGESRITRQAIGEGPEYVPFVLRSHEIWRDLEAATGEALLFTVGGLLLGRPGSGARHHGQADFIGRTIAAAAQYGIPHEILPASEVRRRFPQFRLAGDEVGYYEPGAGFVAPERCIAAQLAVARTHGATVRTCETVARIRPSSTGVEIVTDRERLAADRVIVTAGGWIPGLLGGPFATLLRVYRQVLFWFAPEDATRYAPGRFPVFIWIHGAGEADYFYGFPVVSEGVKLGSEQFVEASEPDGIVRDVSSAEVEAVYSAHVRHRLAGVTARCLRARTCSYTVAPGSRFLVDRHPDSDRVLVVSPCSGHGFKHSAALGEAIAERVVEGASRLDLAPFALERFAVRSPAARVVR